MVIKPKDQRSAGNEYRNPSSISNGRHTGVTAPGVIHASPLGGGLRGTSSRVSRKPGPAKVCNARSQDTEIVGANQHILRLEVPVDDILFMHVVEAARDALRD